LEIGKWWKALKQILRRSKQGKRFEIAIPAYTPEEYEKIHEIQEIQVTTDRLKQTWQEWRQGVDETKIEFTMRGIESVEMLIDTKGLLKYCVENGMLVTPEARMHYAFWLHDQSKNGNKVSQASQEIDKKVGISTPAQPMAGTADTLVYKSTKKSSSSKRAKTKIGKASKKAKRKKK